MGIIGPWWGGAVPWDSEGGGVAKGFSAGVAEEGVRKADRCWMRGPGRGGTMSIFHGSVGAE